MSLATVIQLEDAKVAPGFGMAKEVAVTNSILVRAREIFCVTAISPTAWMILMKENVPQVRRE